jgi:hypothetical protein
MKALQFVAPAPEHHDIDVMTLARWLAGRMDSVARELHQYKELQHLLAGWPAPCFELGRAGVAAPATFSSDYLFKPRASHLVT